MKNLPRCASCQKDATGKLQPPSIFRTIEIVLDTILIDWHSNPWTNELKDKTS